MADAVALEPLAKNPYWDAVVELAERGEVTIDMDTRLVVPRAGKRDALSALLVRYSHAITSPDLVEWVATRLAPSVVEVYADMGYWSSVLRSMGLRTTTFGPKRGLGLFARTYVPIEKQDDRCGVLDSCERDGLLMVLPSVKHMGIAMARFNGDRAVIISSPENLAAAGELGALGGWNPVAEFQGLGKFTKPVMARAFRRPIAVNFMTAATMLLPQVKQNGAHTNA